MKNNNLISNDYSVNGMFRAKLIKIGSDDIRVFVPGISSINPFNEDGTINLTTYESHKTVFPKVQWCCYNVESKEFANQDPLSWVMFENGDYRKPVVISYVVIGGGGIQGASSNGGSIIGNINISTGGMYVGNGTTGDTNGDYIFAKLIEAGASIGGACAVLGNLFVESRFSPTADNGSHRGIAQWDKGGRWDNLVKWCNENGYVNQYDTLEAQTAYLIHDLQTEATWMAMTSNKGWDYICKEYTSENDILWLTDEIRLKFERCDEQGKIERRNATTQYWNTFKTGTIDKLATSASNSSISAYLDLMSQPNTPAREHGNVSDGTQCVEICNHYIEVVFGHKNQGNIGSGNKYYSKVADRYPNTFTKIEYNDNVILQPGDIISMEGYNKKLGHAAIVKAVNGKTITILEQWAGCGYIQTSTFTVPPASTPFGETKRRVIGVARPK